MTISRYDQDFFAWSREQAALLRAGHYGEIDVDHLVEELESMGARERRELTSRLKVLLAHLLKWQYQPERRGASWEKAIKAQRKEIAYNLDDMPSLKPKLSEPRWLDMVWAKSVAQAVTETVLDCFPETCPWAIDNEVLNESWFPGST